MANIITPDRLVALKAAVKAECKRRSYKGSVASYGGTEYDYSNTPAVGQRVAREHYEKIATPLNAITGNIDTSGVRIIDNENITALEQTVSALASKNKTASSLSDTGCAASCTGLCYGDCTSTCSGDCTSACGEDCTGGCSEYCTVTCSLTCAWDCENECANSCYNGCYGNCGDDCATDCGTDCTYNCVGGCYTGCYSSSGGDIEDSSGSGIIGDIEEGN